MSNGRAWFYLTLWHGTPEEFTTELTLEIQESDSAFAYIESSNLAQANIDTAASLSANVVSRNVVETDVTKTTEVIWYVG